MEMLRLHTYWLHLAGDAQHINLSNFNQTLKGINLALQWQLTVLSLILHAFIAGSQIL